MPVYEVFCGIVVGQVGVSAGKYENEFARRDDPHLWQKVAESGRSALHRGQVIKIPFLIWCLHELPDQMAIESYYSITSISYNLDYFKGYQFSYSDGYIFLI